MEAIAFHIFENYFLAILLGALMGLERERKQTRLAGLRTFILVTLFGSICGQISIISTNSWVLLAGILAITVQAAMLHYARYKKEIALGMTTAVALHVAFGIGVLVAMGQIDAAVALSLATTIILYFKPQLHEFTQKLSERDLNAIFQFGLIAFIILPVLPDKGYGPYDALNPNNIWLMVVMISAINLAGYVTLKLVGRRWGGPFLGVLGGIVSSTATTLTFSRHASKDPNFSMTGALVVSLASTVVLTRVAFLVAVIQIELLPGMALPLIAMFCAGLIPAFFIWRKTSRQDSPIPETKNPAEIKQALIFGLLYAVVLLAVSTGEHLLGNKGVYIVSLLSGLTDVDAITLSNARLVNTGTLASHQAQVSILIAYVANLAFKLAMVGVIGTRQMLGWSALCFGCLTLPAFLILL